MRFGLNTFIVSSGFTREELNLIPQFKEWGAETIELAIVEPDQVDAVDLRAELEKHGFSGIPLCGAFTPERDLRGSVAQQQACVTYMEQMIDLADHLGSPIVAGPMYSATGRCALHSAEEREQQMELVSGHLSGLCRRAEAAGVTLAVEPLNRFETDFINTLGQAAELIEVVGASNLKIHADTFHMNIEEDDTAAALAKHGPLIAHVHASASHRGIPGRDQVRWEQVFEGLEDIGYAGDVVLETFALENEVIARATSIWFPRYDSPEQFARESFRFLRGCRSSIQT